MIPTYFEWFTQLCIWWFWILLVGSSASLLLALVTTRILKKGSASVRFLVWKYAFVGILIIPLLPFVLPSIANFTGKIFVNNPSPDVPAVGVNDSMVADRESPPVETGDAIPPVAISPTTVAEARQSVGQQPTQTPAFLAPADLRAGLEIGVVSIWLIGIGFMLWRLGSSHWQVRSLMMQCKKGDSSDEPVFFHDQLETPVAVGIFHTRVIMPSCSRSWATNERQMVLEHELAHIDRKDVFWQFVVSLIKCFIWFQPLAWIASRRMNFEREIACDDHVLNQGCDAVEYSEALLSITTKLGKATITNQLMLQAFEKPIEKRLVSILSDQVNRARPSRLLSVAMGCLFVFGWLAFAVAVAPSTPQFTLPFGANVSGEDSGLSREFAEDELPEGAISQLGTARYRHMEWGKSFHFADSKRLISFAERGGARVWDVATGKLLRKIGSGDPYVHHRCSTTPDGKSLAMLTFFLHRGNQETLHTLSIYQTDMFDEKVVAAWTAPSINRCEHIVLTPDGNHIVSVGRRGEIRVYDVATGNLEIRDQLPEKSYQHIAVSPDSTQLALATHSTLSIVDWRTPDKVRKLENVPRSIEFVGFLPEGQIAIGSRRRRFRSFDLGCRDRKVPCQSGKWECGKSESIWVCLDRRWNAIDR